MKNKNKHNRSCFKRYTFEILLAVEILMSFTFFGYIHIPPVSITIAYLPIIAAGCLFGIKETVITGFVFGAASMYKATANYVMPGDRVFSPFISGKPVSSIILCIGTRVLFALIVGVALSAVKNRKHFRIYAGVISALSVLLYSGMIYTAERILFPEVSYGSASDTGYVIANTCIVLLCVAFTEAVIAIYNGRKISSVRHDVDQFESTPYSEKKMIWSFVVFAFFALCIIIMATVYFAQRAAYMLNIYGINVSSEVGYDLLHLQIQYTMAVLGLNMISINFLLIIYKYISYRKYLSEVDTLTGVMGRRLFLDYCEMIQTEYEKRFLKRGWLLFIDVDNFKTINDTFGHLTGDTVLSEIANSMKKTFDSYGTVGRVGGDEFAVIIERQLERRELEEKLDRFLVEISTLIPDYRVSCSIGGYRFDYPSDLSLIMTEADKALYMAKENGRACYVING